MNFARLGINIDHVATLRQQRDEGYPSLVDAATSCLESGADQITIHLREDRRHIQDTDVEAIYLVTKKYQKPLNLEIGCNEEIVKIAIVVAPDWICLVPENREEKTTEGGLNLLEEKIYQKVLNTCLKIKEQGLKTKISLFLESNQKILEKAMSIPIDAVEIHTGDYARAHLMGDSVDEHIISFTESRDYLISHKMACHAGHGLTDQSLRPLVLKKIFEEYNIGHWVVSEAVFDGLSHVVGKLKSIVIGKDL